MHHALDLTGCVYAFGGNTCPHGQANLRTCSVASDCGHTFLRRIDIPDCPTEEKSTTRFASKLLTTSTARALNINARAKK